MYVCIYIYIYIYINNTTLGTAARDLLGSFTILPEAVLNVDSEATHASDRYLRNYHWREHNHRHRATAGFERSVICFVSVGCSSL